MPCVGFDPTIPASERAKTLHALDRLATVAGRKKLQSAKKFGVYLKVQRIKCQITPTCLLFYHT
jgi:hypothetical protein